MHLETLLRKEDVKVADKLMEDLNVRYDRLFASISGVSTGFPAAPTDLGVKNPPPRKIGAKIMYINKLQKYIVIQTPDNKHLKTS